MTAQPAKRRYTRLNEAEWAEAEAVWASGAASLPELSHRFGTSERGLQARFARRGIEKGQAAKALAAQVVARVAEEQAAQVGTLAERATTIREATYAHAVKVEGMIVARLDAAAADPAQTFAAAAAIKMLTNAASALERLHSLKRSALGISDDDVNDDEIPVLVIRDMTDTEIEDMRNKQDEEDALNGSFIDIRPDMSSQEDDDVVIEDGDEEDDV
ncbi:hypothetical protein PMNALOAF_3165 [Methylobacterium adhaesivum]|uniref:DNA-binding protein n=1 Tax=Methylobacterium adhaesivum TaxID=333297 RepID=A0ABT8BLJ0_9HYPH|nr:hypothetical protein [Methylobacterium adhaesivum]MDN3592385.1 hypothetical protein [Methylobacterium adhaesivum]GJD31901.1 hypothetical protein PMNALOAF_3165 [Methylobacterium adhaesivum]